MRNCLAFLCAVGMASPAAAAWNVARSTHFVIYANDSTKHLEAFATKLEQFDQAVRFATRMDDPPIGDGNRLTVFVLPGAEDVRSIMGDKTGFIAGFYKGRVQGSVAYVPKQFGDQADLGDGNPIFFHEYTHHLMKQDLDRPYPEWYSEGYAEFFSTPKFEHDGSLMLGRPAQMRAWGLFNGPQLPLEVLFQGMHEGMTNAQRDVFYGRAWLLSHYLLLDPHRHGQLSAYIDAISKGVSSIDAARQVFGDLTQLGKELDAYRNKPLVQFRVPASDIHLKPITVAPLTEGGAAVILARARIKNDLSGDAVEPMVAQVRAIEAKYPGDELVESTLAEVELDGHHAAAAEAAAEKALKANPRNTEVLVLKGRAMAELAKESTGPNRHDLFEQARQTLIAANKLDTEDPEPLFEFYRSFLEEGIRPTDNALAALHYASDLAPQDLGVRMNSAIAYLNEGKDKDARATLTVVAYSPHSAHMGDLARHMIADIDAGKARAALMELHGQARQASGH